MRLGQSTPQSKTRKNVTSQPPRENAQVKSKPHLPPIKVNVDSGNDSSNSGKGDNNNRSNDGPNEGTMDDSDHETGTTEEDDQLNSDHTVLYTCNISI